MQRATTDMTTEEHQRWMRRTLDRVIGAVLVVGISGGLLFAWHTEQRNNDRHAKEFTACVELGLSNC
jgi:hypothetical protein